MTDYVDSVRISIESGTGHSGLLPTFEEGALIWDVDYSDSPPPVPPPKPTVIRIPFALTSFLPSQIGPEDDLIDLDVVRQTIIDRPRCTGHQVGDSRLIGGRPPSAL